MDQKLSAAEIKTLQSPETEQVKLILPLLLKELVLNGWVLVRKGKRPGNGFIIAFFAIFALMAISSANVVAGIVGCLMLVIVLFAANQPKTLISITPAGEQILQHYGPSSPRLVKALHTVAFARPQDYDNCTHAEWRKHLRKQYPDNTSFHRDFLLNSMVDKGLVAWNADSLAKRTSKGDAVLAKAEAAIESGRNLPRLLREGSAQASVLAAGLGGLVLLIPDMEGYYHELFNTVGFPDTDLNKPEKQAAGGISSGSDSSSEEKDPDAEHDLDSGNGSDWGGSIDLLDGESGDSGDAGIGADSGCGVGSDGGGDGGGDGGCGGCGGCGGGGD